MPDPLPARQPKPSDEHYKLAANFMNIAAGGTFVAAIATVPLSVFNTHLDLDTAAQLIAILALGSFFLHGVAQILMRQAVS